MGKWLSIPVKEIEKGDLILGSEKKMIVLFVEYDELKEKI